MTPVLRWKYNNHDILIHESTCKVMIDGEEMAHLYPQGVIKRTPNEGHFQLSDGTDIGIIVEPTLDWRNPTVESLSHLYKFSVTANGELLHSTPEMPLNRRSLEKLANEYNILGRLTDEQFLAIKNLSKPVYQYVDVSHVLNGGYKPEIYLDQKGNLDASVDLENNSYHSIKQVGFEGYDIGIGGIAYGDDIAIHTPMIRWVPSANCIYEKDWLTFDKGIAKNTGLECVYDVVYDEKEKGNLAKLSNPDTVFEKFTIEGENMILSTLKIGPDVKALDALIQSMPEQSREAFVDKLTNLIDDVTLSEYQTIRDLRDRGIVITDQIIDELVPKYNGSSLSVSTQNAGTFDRGMEIADDFGEITR